MSQEASNDGNEDQEEEDEMELGENLKVNNEEDSKEEENDEMAKYLENIEAQF